MMAGRTMTKRIRHHGWRSLFVFPIIFLGMAALSHAAGTTAGTIITNRATASYSSGASRMTVESSLHTFAVAEVLDVEVTWQDVPPGIRVSPGAADQWVTMRVTNTGNGNEAFALSAESLLGGDDFDPILSGIWLDTDGNGSFDPGSDQQYVAGTNDPVIAPDAVVTIFIVNAIPATGLSDGNIGYTRLTASAATGSGAPGTAFAGSGAGGTDAVAGASGGRSSASGAYVVSGTTVSVVKSQQVTDPAGGTQPVPGATIRYAISVSIAGSGTAENVVVTDPIPSNTLYRPGTLSLNGVSLSDARDGDAGDVGRTAANTVTVHLGNLAGGSPIQNIMFDVEIQ